MASFGFGPLGAFGGPSDDLLARALAEAARGGPAGFTGAPGTGLPSAPGLAVVRPRPLSFGGLPNPSMPPGAAEPESDGIPVEGHPLQQAKRQVAREQAARPLSFGGPPPGAANVPLPPQRPPEFGGGVSPADMPVQGAVPAMGQAPAMASAGDDGEGSLLDGVMGALGRPSVYNTLLGLGSGLLSTPGFGRGIAAGIDYGSRLNRQQAATDLAEAEYGLKRRKLGEEAQGRNSTVDLLVRRGYPVEDARAMVAAGAAGNREALNNAMSNAVPKRPDTPSGFAPNPDGSVRFIAGGPQDPAVIAAQAGAREADKTTTLLSEDQRVAFGLPAGSYQRDANGRISSVNPTGTTINMGAEKAQDAEIGKAYGKMFVESQQGARSATSTLGTIATMRQALDTPGFYSGSGGNARLAFNRALTSLGMSDKQSAAPAEVFNALSGKLIFDQLGGSLGAGVSNADVRMIQTMGPGLANTPEGNRRLLDAAEALARRQQQVAQMARDYTKANGGRLDAGFDQRLGEFAEANPLFPQAQAGAPAAPQGAPRSLPEGARQAPDGKFYVPDPNRPGRYMQVQ